MTTAPRVFQVGVADGGVPKRAVAAALVRTDGIDGDRQNNTKHHGGPDRAVCIYYLERILALQDEGHTIFPGAAGENITVVGVDPDLVLPGVRLAIGDELLIEVTSYTVPCRTIAPFFVGGDSHRISQDRHPGWSRVYARVLREGVIRAGDRVEFLENTPR